MPQQTPTPTDSSAVSHTRPVLFWLPDSTQKQVTIPAYELKKTYGLDALLHPKFSPAEMDSLLVSAAPKNEWRTSAIRKEPFGKPLQEEPYSPVDNFWLSLFIVAGFFAAGTISYGNRKSFSMLLKSTVSNRALPEIMRDRTHITGVFFTAPFMLSMMLNGIFIGYTLRASHIFSLPGALEVLLVCAAVVGVQLIKNLLLKGIGGVFEMQYNTERHILYSQQFFCFSSWIYLPVLAIALAIPVNNVEFFHIFLIANISLSVIYTTERLFVNFSYNGLSSIGLFILYICSTEVLPVLLFLKTIYLIKDF